MHPTRRRLLLSLALSLPLLAAGATASADASVTAGFLANTSTTGGVVYFPSLGVDLPTPAQSPVTGISGCDYPQGAVYYEADHALVACFGQSRVLVVQASTASVSASIDTTDHFDGMGTIAVAPGLQYALAASGYGLTVIHAPFDAPTSIADVSLPGPVEPYQGQAVVFDPAGNAYVRTDTGISVVAPPYTAVSFTIPLASGAGLGISPDGRKLLAPDVMGTSLRILTAPFSASSTAEALTIPGSGLDGIMVSPDGSCAILAGIFAAEAWAVQAPFSASSTVEALPVPEGAGGFEDVAVSADGQLAVLTGNGEGSAPLIVIAAPFTAAGATAYGVTVPGGRGAGSFRFIPPGLAPGPTLSAEGPTTVGAGGDLAVTLTYGNTGTGDMTGARITQAIPEGATFVSASGGGALADGAITWELGTVAAGASGLTVSYVLNVSAAAGSTLNVPGAAISADGGGTVYAGPLSVSVTDAVVYTVTFQTDGTPGAVLEGSASQAVTAGGATSAVTAVAPEGYAFAGWAGADGFSSTDNPLVIEGVSGDLIVTATFGSTGGGRWSPGWHHGCGCGTDGGGAALVALPLLLLALRPRRRAAQRS